MNITNGDYARFNDRTYLEVYEEIKLEAKKEYLTEVELHNHTKQELEEVTRQNVKLSHKIDLLNQSLQEYQNEQNQKAEKRFTMTTTVIGNLFSLVLLAIPYIFFLVKLEFIKAKYASQVTKGNIVYLTIAVVAGLILVFIHTQLKKLIIYFVKKIVKKFIC